MSRESVAEKSARYLSEHRLLVTVVSGDTVRATCQGTAEAAYTLGHTRAGGWYCTCPARHGCAHLAALHLVTTRRSE